MNFSNEQRIRIRKTVCILKRKENACLPGFIPLFTACSLSFITGKVAQESRVEFFKKLLFLTTLFFKLILEKSSNKHKSRGNNMRDPREPHSCRLTSSALRCFRLSLRWIILRQISDIITFHP